MPRKVNYKMQLLRAVSAYLEGSIASKQVAHRIVADIPSPAPFTFGSVIWGPVISMLKDSVFYDDRDTLLELRQRLRGTTNEVHRVYVRRDFRPLLSDVEQDWYAQLVDLVAFLEDSARLRAGDTDQEIAMVERVQRVYEHKVGAMDSTLSTIARETPLEEEEIYLYLMREISAIVVNIDLRLTIRRSRYLTPGGENTVISENQSVRVPPDATSSLVWARRALRIIIGEEWLFMGWRMNGNTLLVSTH